MRINKNSTTIDGECDNQDSPHKDNEPKKTYNNNFNNNNNHMDTNDAATRLPKNHILKAKLLLLLDLANDSFNKKHKQKR